MVYSYRDIYSTFLLASVFLGRLSNLLFVLQHVIISQKELLIIAFS